MALSQPLCSVRVDNGISTPQLPFRKCQHSCGYIPELKLGDVERQIFPADFVEAADDPALEDRPEAFNRVGVDRTDDVLTRAVVNDAMRIHFAKVVIGPIAVSAEQTDFGGNGFPHEGFESNLIDLADDAGHNIALAADGSDHNGFK